MKIALRVDVDTFRGTRRGVPSLLRTMDRHGVRAAYFFSVGPDNMGRNLWRLLKPTFFWKMMRTRAASLYGWDILLMGTMWPGPRIGRANESVLRDCAKAGHEIGLHAWDHCTWQNKIDKLSTQTLREHLKRAYEEIERIVGAPPTCSAAPGWKCTEDALAVKEEFHFRYGSDCRGSAMFLPVVEGKRLSTPQIPLNMPTYDEMLGRNGVTRENYNERLLATANPDGFNLLTIHAEAEGGSCADLFDDFLSMAKSRGVEFCAPGDLLPQDPLQALPSGRIEKGVLPGREGWMALQKDSEPNR